ncbi:MAG: Tat pathway signal protein, partial [Alphaproteobacteria bacterium]|nr:Tat pathway signal protein [Alphaproteobacteria bacterium]
MGRASKYLAATLLAICVAAPGASAQSPQERELYEAAKKEGQLTWYTAHYDQQLSTEIGNAFTARYPGIRVNVIKATAQVSFQRLLQDIKAGQVQSDVFSTTDVSHFVHL